MPSSAKATRQPDLLSRVRQETRAQHQQLEVQLHLDGSLTLERYRDLLISFWGFFDPLEKRLVHWRGLEHLDLEQRGRSALLLQDLRDLGLTAGQLTSLSCCVELPGLNSTSQALGCLYVLEGSRLGGQYVAKAVAEQLGFRNAQGCAFFTSNGDDVVRIWNQFCSFVQERVIAPGEQEEFVETARVTFATFERWLMEKNAELV